MKIKDYNCNIRNNKFLFINAKNAVVLVDSRNDKRVYLVNISNNSFVF